MEKMPSQDSTRFRAFFGAREETISRLKKLYGESYFEESAAGEMRERMYRLEFERLRRYIDTDKGGSVLDIGCGTGGFLSLFGGRWTKYGIEVSDYARAVAGRKGIITDFDLSDNSFDLIVFRGTIQHIPDPVARIGECFYWLKEGGVLAFLATPNTNSIYYKLFGDLPMLNGPYNFLLPSDSMLTQILVNFGFRVRGVEYPYLGTPYARPLMDIFSFMLKLFRIKKDISFPFYGNMMECYAVKERP